MKRVITDGPGYCAVTEDGILVEYIRKDDRDQSGSIVTGRVERLMPGMDCAFVDIGRKKSGFLPLKEESNSFKENGIRSGETLILQIKKEETGSKGAFLTRDIMLPGSLVIVMPMNRYIGVSNRIKEETIREELKRTGHQISGGRFGLVMRNAALTAQKDMIHDEAEKLFATWIRIAEQAKRAGCPGELYAVNDPLIRLKEDYAASGYETNTVSQSPSADFIRQLGMATERTIRLPGGGNVVIDRCEAMTVIDVNTASSIGTGNKERTVLETNLEACKTIAQQIRLRNLGGIILIDFIDMDNETDKSMVFSRLSECFSADRIKTVIHGWTKLGLMEMTRKRTGIEKKTER